MKIGRSHLSAPVAFAIGMLAGCAGIPQGDVERRAADVTVYKVDQRVGQSYDIVRRLWTESWRTAFWAPTFPSEDEAIASMRAEAARMGADGLVNVNCLDQGRSAWSQSPEPALLCYGIAVRLRQKQG
jgi:hypothetical protein